MPFFRLTTDDDKSWVFEYSGVGKIYEFIAEFGDHDKARRYVEFENAKEGVIDGTAIEIDDGPSKSHRFPILPSPRAVNGSGNDKVILTDREKARQKAIQRMLSKMMQLADKKGEVVISIEKLAKVIGISHGATARYIDSLVESGELVIVNQAAGPRPATYFLNGG
ncbi:hypothetical protein [Hyphomicrobium sp.]|uniref:hypothetical protein n=1 Tax=Hyphomicrobium sp. TaxID=82 RepID=UPI001E0F25F4|nr:hypothetical protein [Hyphomicrobium sp.]MBY0561429.1 helix-turn-helix domain-containing protein [Hyphomicrobium sp.]